MEEAVTLDHAEASIAADWERIQASAELPPEDGEESGAQAPAAPKSGQERGADGKFVVQTQAKEAAPATEEAVPPIAGEAGAEGESAAAAAPVESPKSLRKELADKHWGALPTEIQQAWQERDTNYERGIQRYKERADFADRMDAVFSPYAQTLQQVNATPEQAVQTLLGMDHILRHGAPTEKAALIAQLAEQFHVPLEHLPQIGPLQKQLLQQAQQLHAHQTQQSIAQAQQAQRELDSLTSEVVKFSEGKEHFGVVSQEMFSVLPSISQQFPNATPQEKLQKAYDIAVNANPTARAAIAEQQRQVQLAEARKKTVDARKAASTNRAPKGVIVGKSPVGSMEDTIRAEAERLGLA